MREPKLGATALMKRGLKAAAELAALILVAPACGMYRLGAAVLGAERVLVPSVRLVKAT